MKKQILSIAAVIALTAAGALTAQNPQNTTAPGPTMQQEPGQTNNNLPNPGNPQTNLQNPATSRTPNTTTTMQQPTTGIAPETEQGEGMDVDIDTGDRANGAVDVDVTRTTDADTDASGINETGENTGTTGTYGADNAEALPETAGELPTVALLGLFALAAAFAVRRIRQNA